MRLSPSKKLINNESERPNVTEKRSEERTWLMSEWMQITCGTVIIVRLAKISTRPAVPNNMHTCRGELGRVSERMKIK